MQNQLVSVLMSVYNERPAWLRQAIESILDQTHRDIEFIIVLDAPDNAPLEEIIREYAGRDARVVFVKNERNRGIVYSLNRALALAHGAYIARMDADDVSLPTRFEAQLEALEEGFDFVASTVCQIDEEGAPLDPPDTRFGGYGWGAEACREITRINNFMPHPTWMTRAEVFRSVGPYHEIPRAEDYEWLCRALLSGVRMRKMGEPLLHYRIRSDSISSIGVYAQRRAAHAIRAEYKKALARGRDFDTAALERRLARLERELESGRGERGLKAYYGALEKWETSHLACRLALLRTFAQYPIMLSWFTDRRRLTRLRAEYFVD